MEDGVLNVGKSEAKKRADEKYRKQYLDYITIRTRKDDRTRELINMASEKLGVSSNVYVIDAINHRLSSDGVTIDMLPPTEKFVPKPEPKQPKQYIIYMITEQYNHIDDEETYIATFPTLNMAEKYAKNKFEKKAHPNDWSYTIYGRSVEGDNKLDACNKLKAMIREELKYDEEHGIRNDGSELTYVDRLNERAPADYIDVILYDGEYTEEELNMEDLDF